MMFPTEVFESVIDQARDDAASLRHLSLTCSTFLPRARYHLFTSIKIQTVQQLESSRDFLDSRESWLIPRVQKVVLFILIPDDNSVPDHVRLLGVVQVHLLTRLPNLRAWSMERNLQGNFVPSKEAWLSFHRSALRCYQKYSLPVHNLDLSGIPFDNLSDFMGLVSAFTGIHSLTCSTISFRTTREHDFSFLHDSGVNASRRLKIQTMNLSTSVDVRAVEYLLSSGGVALNNLKVEVPENAWDPGSDYFERFLRSMDWIPRLSSVSFVIHVGWHHTLGKGLSRVIRSAARFLEHIQRVRPTDVRVEFKSDPIASLGNCLSQAAGSALLKTCAALEEALLAFPTCHILVHDPSICRRAGRLEFWSPTIHRAFPTLNKRGFLTISRTKPDALDVVGHEGELVGLVASHDSKRIVTASDDGTIVIWNASHGTVSQEWLAHQGPVAGFALSPDSRRLVTASDIRSDSTAPTLAIWEIGSSGVRKVTTHALQDYTEAVWACAWSSDGALVASLSSIGLVRVWDSRILQLRDQLEDPPPPPVEYMAPPCLQFSPDARCLAWTSGYGCCLWRPLTGGQPKRLPSHPSRAKVRINAIGFAPDSARIATAHGPLRHGTVDPDESVVRIWDVATGVALGVLAGHSQRVADVSFSPDGRSLVSASDDGSARIWDAESAAQTASLEESGDAVSKALFHPGGKHIAIVSGEKRVKLWKMGDSACTATFTEHKRPVRHIAFSPNGKFLASGDGEGVVRIRRLELVRPLTPC